MAHKGYSTRTKPPEPPSGGEIGVPFWKPLYKKDSAIHQGLCKPENLGLHQNHMPWGRTQSPLPEPRPPIHTAEALHICTDASASDASEAITPPETLWKLHSIRATLYNPKLGGSLDVENLQSNLGYSAYNREY